MPRTIREIQEEHKAKHGVFMEEEDAIYPLVFVIKNKIKHQAKCYAKNECVIAVVLSKAIPGIDGVEVSGSLVKIVLMGSNKIYRYQTTSKLRNALVAFDKTGEWDLPDGTYTLRVPTSTRKLRSQSERWEEWRQKLKGKKKPSKTAKKPIGVFKGRAVPTRRINISPRAKKNDLMQVVN